MSKEPLTHDAYLEALREHEELRDRLGQAHRLLADGRVAVSQVAAHLEDLAEHIRLHFRQEESGGYFTPVVAQAPQAAERAGGYRRCPT